MVYPLNYQINVISYPRGNLYVSWRSINKKNIHLDFFSTDYEATKLP